MLALALAALPAGAVDPGPRLLDAGPVVVRQPDILRWVALGDGVIGVRRLEVFLQKTR